MCSCIIDCSWKTNHTNVWFCSVGPAREDAAKGSLCNGIDAHKCLSLLYMPEVSACSPCHHLHVHFSWYTGAGIGPIRIHLFMLQDQGKQYKSCHLSWHWLCLASPWCLKSRLIWEQLPPWFFGFREDVQPVLLWLLFFGGGGGVLSFSPRYQIFRTQGPCCMVPLVYMSNCNKTLMMTFHKSSLILRDSYIGLWKHPGI